MDSLNVIQAGKSITSEGTCACRLFHILIVFSAKSTWPNS